MSLSKENDMIIPNTTGIISALGKEANEATDLVTYIRETSTAYRIASQRVNGISLDQLVNPARISSDEARVVNQQKQSKITAEDKGRAYESWFKDRVDTEFDSR